MWREEWVCGTGKSLGGAAFAPDATPGAVGDLILDGESNMPASDHMARNPLAHKDVLVMPPPTIPKPEFSEKKCLGDFADRQRDKTGTGVVYPSHQTGPPLARSWR